MTIMMMMVTSRRMMIMMVMMAYLSHCTGPTRLWKERWNCVLVA